MLIKGEAHSTAAWTLSIPVALALSQHIDPVVKRSWAEYTATTPSAATTHEQLIARLNSDTMSSEELEKMRQLAAPFVDRLSELLPPLSTAVEPTPINEHLADNS